MRLEDMSFTDYLMAECDLRERQRKEQMKQKEFEKYAKEHNIFYCTKELGEQIKVETPPILEQIRAEIANLTCDCINGMVNQYAVLQIIDKYAKQAKGEPNDNH